MKVENNKSNFNWVISRVLVLVALMSFLMGPWNALASSETDESVSRGEFIAMMANHQPDSPFLPREHSQLSNEELYLQTVQNMTAKGFRVLEGKSIHEPLEANEFVQVSYLFAEGPSGKNLFEQKLYLKNAGIIDSADVGLTTAYDGKVYQTHRDASIVNPVKLATPIYMNDRIKTDLLAKATFTFDDKSTLTLAEGSTVNITKHIYDPNKDLRQTIVHLSEGTVRFVVTKGKAKGSMFKVITPTATAGVRGTEFVVSVGPHGKTTFIVLEGQIETKPFVISGKAETFLVSAGEIHNVSKNGKPDKVKKAPPGQLKKVQAKTSKPKKNLNNKGLSKKATRNKVGKLAMVKKPKNNKGSKTAKNNKGSKSAKNDKGMKVKVLKMAKNSALVDAKSLNKKFERIKGEKSAKLTPNGSGKSNAKGNAKGNAKANAKNNAKGNAKANAKNNAKQAAKQVAQENGKGKGKGRGKGKGKP